MKTYKFLTITFLSALLLVGCTNDFDQINSNPNRPENVTPNLLLATVTSTIPNRLVRIGWYNGNIVSQLTAKNNFVDFDTYQWDTESGIWNTFYGILPEIEDIIKTSEGSNDTYHGIALVMKAITFAQLTDNWGDIPASEAIKGLSDGNFTPAFDTQQDIYNQILSYLETADTLLANNQSIFGGDLIYGGNASKWRKLANSLRLRFLLRMSKQIDVSSQMQAIVNSGNIFQGNEDNATLTYQGNTNDDSWFMSTSRIGSFDEHSLSLTALNFMGPLNDPRLEIWYDEHPNSGVFGGMPNGLNQDNARNYDSDNDVSRLNQALFYDSATDAEAAIMKYSELQFILAEAHQRGFITTGSAATYYTNGIQATLEYWGADNADITTYLALPDVVFNNTVERIMNQKWLASFLVDNQGWYDYRRTGFPSFIIPGPDNVNSNQVPVRYFYPDNQKTLNADNYQAALSTFGPDEINTKGWWEKGTRY